MFFAYILFLLSLKEISLFVKMFIDLSCNIFFAIILKQEIELNPFPKFVNYIFGTDVSLMNWEITIIFPSVLWVSVCEYIDIQFIFQCTSLFSERFARVMQSHFLLNSLLR